MPSGWLRFWGQGETVGALLFAHNLPWREAGKQSHLIVQELWSLPAGPKRLDRVPDHYLGAYVFRNGLDLVGRSVGEVQGEICWRTLESDTWRGKCEPEAVLYRWTGGRFEAGIPNSRFQIPDGSPCSLTSHIEVATALPGSSSSSPGAFREFGI